jgi:hypothetical protein
MPFPGFPAARALLSRSSIVRARALLVLTLVLHGTLARADRSIERIDARLRAKASAAVKDKKQVGRRENLTRVTYASGVELLHIRPAGNKDNPRGILERGVYLTARHLGVPLHVAPPIVEHEGTVYGKGWVSPWIPGLRNIMEGDGALSRDLTHAGWRQPERVDWDSVHAVVVLDFVTGQADRAWNNVFIRERRGKMTAVALDNELTFGHTSGEVIPIPSSPYGLLIRNAPASARKLSPRIRRGLDAIDVEAWKADLRRTGIAPHEIEAAAGRLRQVKEHGLAAIFPEAGAW